MSKMSKPTESQVAFLEARGIIPPPTKPACSDTIRYIKQGNGTGTPEQNEFSRAALMRSIQSQWLGKTARLQYYEGQEPEIVTVIWIKAKDSLRVWARQVYGVPAHPLEAMVKSETTGKRKLVTMGALKKVP